MRLKTIKAAFNKYFLPIINSNNTKYQVRISDIVKPFPSIGEKIILEEYNDGTKRYLERFAGDSFNTANNFGYIEHGLGSHKLISLSGTVSQGPFQYSTHSYYTDETYLAWFWSGASENPYDLVVEYLK